MYGIKSRRTGRSEPSTYLIYHSCCRRLLVNSPTWVKPGIQFGIQVACKNQEFWVSRLPVLVFWTRAHLRQLHLQIEIGAGMQKTKILGILILGNWFLALGHRKESSAAAAANENATQYRKYRRAKEGKTHTAPRTTLLLRSPFLHAPLPAVSKPVSIKIRPAA